MKYSYGFSYIVNEKLLGLEIVKKMEILERLLLQKTDDLVKFNGS